PLLPTKRLFVDKFQTQVCAPSNIALIKYWGKHGVQLPMNPSLSLTLKDSKTLLELEATVAAKMSVELWFHEQRNEKFEKDIFDFLESLSSLYPELKKYHFKI